MLFIGVDPGTKGALCVLDTTTNHPVFVSMDPKKHGFNELVGVLQDAVVGQSAFAALEEVHSLPGMAAKSNFTFGGMFWRAKSLLEAAWLNFELVQPKAWQQAVGAPTRKFLDGEMDLKVAIADLAQGFYPTARLHGPKGGLMDGRSDALMIAHYLRLKHGV